MHRTKKRNFKWIVDLCMTLVLLCLMAYQVCGEVLHEWGGVVMTLLLIVHHILNRRWYASLFKGRYNAYRVVTVVVNTLLLGCIALTALCGMSMSAHAVPFLYGLLHVSFARQFHLALSYWSFVLMGFHLGLHVPAITAGLKMNGKVKAILSLLCAGIAGVGVWLFLKNSLPDYMLFRTPFAFLDYDKAAVLVFAENLAMLIAFAHLGDCCANLCKAFGSHGKKRTFLSPLLLILLAIGISAFLFLCSGGSGVAWDRSANGYRLPTEAEWKYACRAGTETPFNTEHSLDAEQANFYGHYPYEIEENYFNDSVLEARPGQYRQTTVAVGSFYASRWDLYDMHGNVNEWCWDYYGAYDPEQTDNPTGPASGTRHVYRGGGWNDFGKNMRSAYRAAGQAGDRQPAREHRAV